MGQKKVAYRLARVQLGSHWLTAKCMEGDKNKVIAVVLHSDKAVEMDLVSLTLTVPRSRVQFVDRAADPYVAADPYARDTILDKRIEKLETKLAELKERDSALAQKEAALTERMEADLEKRDRLLFLNSIAFNLLVWNKRGHLNETDSTGLVVSAVGDYFEVYQGWPTGWGHDISGIIFGFLIQKPQPADGTRVLQSVKEYLDSQLLIKPPSPVGVKYDFGGAPALFGAEEEEEWYVPGPAPSAEKSKETPRPQPSFGGVACTF